MFPNKRKKEVEQIPTITGPPALTVTFEKIPSIVPILLSTLKTSCSRKLDYLVSFFLEDSSSTTTSKAERDDIGAKVASSTLLIGRLGLLRKRTTSGRLLSILTARAWNPIQHHTINTAGYKTWPERGERERDVPRRPSHQWLQEQNRQSFCQSVLEGKWIGGAWYVYVYLYVYVDHRSLIFPYLSVSQSVSQSISQDVASNTTQHNTTQGHQRSWRKSKRVSKFVTCCFQERAVK